MKEPDQAGSAGHRFGYLGLLVSLLVLFIVTPFLAQYGFGLVVINVVGAVVLLFAMYVVRVRRRFFVMTILFATLSIICNAVLWFKKVDVVVILFYSCVIVFLFLVSISILADVLKRSRVTADKIYASVCVYVLIGFGWGFVYALMEDLEPGSFSGLEESGSIPPHVSRMMQLRYYSFTTLSTVGYGDILPKSEAARTAAMLEAIMGQIYLAVLVARLVGLHIVHGSSDSKT